MLITTVDTDGRVNAAAFGTCTRVCHDPMYIAFTCGTGKDTYDNVLATGEFVVNVVPFEQAMLDKTLVCGLPFRGGENELVKAGLTARPGAQAASRRASPSAAAISNARSSGRGNGCNRLMVCGKVEAVSIDEDCITDQGLHRVGQGQARALLRHALPRPLRAGL